MAIVVPQIKELRETATKDGKGEWPWDFILNFELYPMLRSIRRAVQGLTNTGPYVKVQDEGVDLPQQPALNFIGSIITATDDEPNARTNVTLNAPPPPMLIEWGAGDLISAAVSTRALNASGSSIGANHPTTTRVTQGPGQRYMLFAGTWDLMLACIRGPQPGATDIIWTYTLSVNEAASAMTDSYNIRSASGDPEYQITTGISVHTDVGDRVGLWVATDVAVAQVNCPYVALRFTPDP